MIRITKVIILDVTISKLFLARVFCLHLSSHYGKYSCMSYTSFTVCLVMFICVGFHDLVETCCFSFTF
jgi:hypothetical protein